MKHEVISEVISNISEDYLREALELRNKVVSENDGMRQHKSKKTILIAGLVAVLTAALGSTAYATGKGMFGIKINDPEPGETRVLDTEAHGSDPGDLSADDLGNESDYEIYQSLITEEYEVTVFSVTRYFSFDGAGNCKELEFRLSDVPDNYTHFTGAFNYSGWYSMCQGVEFDEDGLECNVFNVNIYYATDFGPDGSLFLEDAIISEETYEEDDKVIYKLETRNLNSENNTYYYIVYDTVNGSVIVVASSTGMEDSMRIYNGLKLHETGKELEYIEGANHDIWLQNFVG